MIQVIPAPARASVPGPAPVPAGAMPTGPAIRRAVRHPEAGLVFHLSNGRFGCAFMVLEDGSLGSLYLGRALRQPAARLSRREARGYSGGVFAGDHEFCLEHVRQEYPGQLRTDYRSPAFVLRGPDGSGLSGFSYQSHQLLPGKPDIPGLPASYVETPEEAQTLCVVLQDQLLGTTLRLYWTIRRDFNGLSRWASFEQPATAGCTVSLQAAMSASFDLPLGEGRLLTLHGAWSRERQPVLRDLVPGVQGASSCRGASGHFQHPFAALLAPGADEAHGEVFGLSLVYSGNFETKVETDTFGVTRLWTGINRDTWAWELAPGSQFHTPEAVLAWSDTGLGGMSRALNRLYRTRLARGPWRDRGRPVLVNTWEAAYFGVDEATVLRIARSARDLGVELVVLDDGWFKGRQADTTSLGDWVPDPVKFSHGLGWLGREVEHLGLKFGLWLEPEMVSEDSDLFRAHPDWLLQVPGRPQSHGRNQFTLDLGRPQVQEHLIATVNAILADAPVAYVKWDMNRPMTDVASLALPPHRQPETAHRYMLGLYHVLEVLTQTHPQILWESCAGGGGRFDPGMLHYMCQAWASDDTDAVERLRIQYASSLVYPVSSLGAHVSVVPNHQTGRAVPFGFRALAALFGTFGYELDPDRLDEPDRQAARWWSALCRRERDFVVQGDFWRLRPPFGPLPGSPAGFPGTGHFGDSYAGLAGEGNTCAWMVVAPDRSRALVAFFLVQNRPNQGFGRLVLQGLDPDLDYQVQAVDASRQACWSADPMPAGYQAPVVVQANTGRRGGDELMTLGLALGGESWAGIARGDHQAVLFIVEACLD